MTNPALDVGYRSPDIAFVPSPIEGLRRISKLDDQIELTAVPSSSSLSLTMHHDKNFAALFPVFDVIFGTAYRHQAHE